VSRPLFLADDVGGARVVLTGAEGRHAATVRRLRIGEEVDVADGRGTRVTGPVAAVGKDVVEVTVVARSVEPPPQPRLVLVQALAKGERAELAVELATEVGVDEVVPWAAQRCVVRWEGERGARALARWRATAREAGKQARRARLPEVAALAHTSDVVARARDAALTLVLHEVATAPLAATPLPSHGDVLLVVGPEGGVTDGELEVLAKAGARAVRLGGSVLRTSTAGAAAAAVVSARTARWS
jgi:16S rRNA (uracil1498-N3)-methyltransferase